MSRAKTRKVICTPGKNCGKHKMHEDAVPIKLRLEKLTFVANVNSPLFKHSNKPEGIDVRYFDGGKNSYLVKVYLKGFMQIFYVRIKGKKEEDYHKKAIENVFYQDLSKTL